MFYRFRNRFKYNVKTACVESGFKLSSSFLKASNKKITDNWNGIGAAGKWYNKYIPKSILFLNVQLPSCPHDWDYKVYRTLAKKRKADRNLLRNLLIWVRRHTDNRWLLRLREIGCYKYYLAVKYAGGEAFWKNKNREI